MLVREEDWEYLMLSMRKCGGVYVMLVLLLIITAIWVCFYLVSVRFVQPLLLFLSVVYLVSVYLAQP